VEKLVTGEQGLNCKTGSITTNPILPDQEEYAASKSRQTVYQTEIKE